MTRWYELQLKRALEGYDRSIWFFSFLIVFIFFVFSLGSYFNMQVISGLWTEQEDINFTNFSKSIALLISQYLKESPNSNLPMDELRTSLQSVLRPYSLDSRDRIYIFSRKQVIQVFPEKFQTLKTDSPAVPNKNWLEGWQGKRYITVQYQAYDGRLSKAYICPVPAYAMSPDYIAVVERVAEFDHAVDRAASLFKGILVLSMIGILTVTVQFVRVMTAPFKKLIYKLREILPQIDLESTLEQDPIQYAIDAVNKAYMDLKQKEAELSKVNESLATHSARFGEFEDAFLMDARAGIMMFDRESKLLSKSRNIEMLTGLSSYSAAGYRCDELFGRGSLFCSMLEDGLRNGKTHKRRIWRVPQSGDQIRWASISTFLNQNAQGRTLAVSFIIKDVTEAKRLEEQLKEQEHLAALGELSAGIAHEIRNPLGVIRGNADYLSDEVKDTAMSAIVDEIKDQVVNLDRIISDFLKFSRPARPIVTATNLMSLFEELLREISQEFGDRITTSLTCEDLATVQMDENLMRQVFQNLLLNSVQAIPDEGLIQVEIKAHTITCSSSQNVKAVKISIRDSGVGIMPENHDKLFSPFFTTKAAGTGLGLAIARRFIMLHNGFIEFDTQMAKGSLLIITLPVEYDEERTIDFNV